MVQNHDNTYIVQYGDKYSINLDFTQPKRVRMRMEGIRKDRRERIIRNGKDN